MTKFIRESNKEGIHLTLSKLKQKCETVFRTQSAITYWLMKTWPGIILQQQLHYGMVVLTFGFFQRSTLKLKILY